MHSCELFSLKDNQSIIEMSIGFTDIINRLQALKKIYTEF